MIWSRGFTVLLPGILQALSYAVESDLNRPLGQVHRPGYLRLRQVVAIAEVYQQTVVRAKPCQRLTGGDRRDQGLDRLLARSLRFARHDHLAGGPPGAALHDAQRFVARDPQQPAQWGVRALARAASQPSTRQGLLHGFLGVLAVAQETVSLPQTA
jgi:hypothetical protein